MFERRSSLTGLISADQGISSGKTLRIGEVPDFSLLQVSAFPHTLRELERIFDQVFGMRLPPRIGVAARHGDVTLFKVGPEQFWFVSASDKWGATLRDAVLGEVGSFLMLSHSRARLFVDGDVARQVLSTGIGLDLHPSAFPVDAFALTELQHTATLLHRVAADRYELYVPSTFAEWIWEWLSDAALPHGAECVVKSVVVDG